MFEHVITKFKKWATLGSYSADPGLRSLTAAIGQLASSGEIITADTVLQNPGVLNGCRAIATNCSRIPFNVYKRKPDGSRQKAINHPAQALLQKPNRYSTRSVMFSSWVTQAIVWGNSYIYVSRDEFANPTELSLLDPSQTGIVVEDGEVYYTTLIDGRFRKFEVEDVLHLRGLSNDGLSGLPLYQILAETFALGLTMNRYQNLFFKNGNRPSLIVHLPPEISSREAQRKFAEDWKAVHEGLPNAFKTSFLRPGSQIEVLAQSNDTAQLNQLKESDLVAVANALGIPSNVINGRMSSVAYGSVEEEKRSFLDVIDCWTTQIEQEFSSKLLKTMQQGSHYVEGNRKALIQNSPKDEAVLICKYRNNGLLSDEEARQLINMPTDFEGTFWMPSNLVTREKALSPAPVATAKAITRQSIDRLLRRAKRNGKLELELWQQEFSALPGIHKLSLPVEEYACVLPEQRQSVLDTIDTEQLCEELWTK